MMERQGDIVDELENMTGAFTKGELEAKLVAISAQPYRPSTWGLPFGANTAGIYSACPPEMLHQFDLGIFREVWKGIMKLIKDEATEARKPGDLTRRCGVLDFIEYQPNFNLWCRLRILDGRFQKLEVRHSVEDMPREKFNRGGSSITGMRADQFNGLMWQYLVVLGIEDPSDVSVMTAANKGRVSICIHALVSLRERLWKKEISESEVVELETDIIPRCED
jgi:hypothetical protein